MLQKYNHSRKDINFDIIIDDGSHDPMDQEKSFNILKGQMNTGGVYVIEDIICFAHNKHFFLKQHPYCRSYDLRSIKNRYDDCLIVYEFH